jgi:hypothetical protein
MSSLPLYILTGLLFFAPPGSAAPTSVKALLEQFLSQGDIKDLSNSAIGAISDRLDDLRFEPAAEVRQILPSARLCLRSPSKNLRTVGLMAFIAVGLRPDSADLLAAYTSELGALLDDPEPSISGPALQVLELLHPRPPASLVPYLLPHLADKTNSTQTMAGLFRLLLLAAPDDPVVFGAVLEAVRERPGLRANALGIIGSPQSGNETAIAFVGAGLTDPDPDIRSQAVQAIGRLPVGVIHRFEQQLRRIAIEPDEQPTTRDLASLAIRQIGPH